MKRKILVSMMLVLSLLAPVPAYAADADILQGFADVEGWLSSIQGRIDLLRADTATMIETLQGGALGEDFAMQFTQLTVNSRPTFLSHITTMENYLYQINNRVANLQTTNTLLNTISSHTVDNNSKLSDIYDELVYANGTQYSIYLDVRSCKTLLEDVKTALQNLSVTVNFPSDMNVRLGNPTATPMSVYDENVNVIQDGVKNALWDGPLSFWYLHLGPAFDGVNSSIASVKTSVDSLKSYLSVIGEFYDAWTEFYDNETWPTFFEMYQNALYEVLSDTMPSMPSMPTVLDVRLGNPTSQPMTVYEENVNLIGDAIRNALWDGPASFWYLHLGPAFDGLKSKIDELITAVGNAGFDNTVLTKIYRTLQDSSYTDGAYGSLREVINQLLLDFSSYGDVINDKSYRHFIRSIFADVNNVNGRMSLYRMISDIRTHASNIKNKLDDVISAINAINVNVVIPPDDAFDLIGDFDALDFGDDIEGLLDDIKNLAPFGAVFLLSDFVNLLATTNPIATPSFDFTFGFTGDNQNFVISLAWLEDARMLINFISIALLTYCLAVTSMKFLRQV